MVSCYLNFLALGVLTALGQPTSARAEVDGGLASVRIDRDPPGARVILTAAAQEPKKGHTPFHTRLPLGPLQLEVRAPGFNPVIEPHALDGPWKRRVYLDPAGQLLHREGVFKTGRWPKQVALTPDGRELWVTALAGPPSLYIHDAATFAKVASLRLGHEGTVEVIFNGAGTRAYVTQMEAGLVYEIDVAAHRVLRTLDVEGKWPKVLCLSPDEKTLYTSNWSSADVSEIDLASGQVKRRLDTVKIPRGLYAMRDGSALWVAGFGRGELARVDLRTGVSTTVFAEGGTLRHIAGDEAHGVLYVSDMRGHCIWVVELKTQTVRRLARTDANPNTIALSPDGQVLFVSCRGPNGPEGYEGPAAEPGTLIAIDTQTGAQLDGVVAGEQPTALALSRDGTLLYHSDLHDNRVEVFRVPDTATLRAGNGGRSRKYRRDLKPLHAAPGAGAK